MSKMRRQTLSVLALCVGALSGIVGIAFYNVEDSLSATLIVIGGVLMILSLAVD